MKRFKRCQGKLIAFQEFMKKWVDTRETGSKRSKTQSSNPTLSTVATQPLGNLPENIDAFTQRY